MVKAVTKTLRNCAYGIALGAGVVSATLSLGAGRAQAADETELVFAGFGGSLQKALQATVIPAFEKKYGVRVYYVTGTSNQLLAKVRAQRDQPQIDVMWANDTTHYQGKTEELFEKLDPQKVPNLADLYDFAKDPDGIGVVMGIQALALEYNTEVFKENNWPAPTSWMDLWDEKFEGHAVFYNMPIGYMNMVLLKVAQLNGGSADNLDPAWKLVEQIVPKALAFVDPPAQVDALFGTGSAYIGFNGSARIADFAGTGAPVAMAVPKEGAILYPQQFDVVKNAPHPELAQKFVDFVLSEEAQKQNADTMYFGPVNKTVKLGEDVASKVPYGPEYVEKLDKLDMDKINAQLQDLTARWTSTVGGH